MKKLFFFCHICHSFFIQPCWYLTFDMWTCVFLSSCTSTGSYTNWPLFDLQWLEQSGHLWSGERRITSPAIEGSFSISRSRFERENPFRQFTHVCILTRITVNTSVNSYCELNVSFWAYLSLIKYKVLESHHAFVTFACLIKLRSDSFCSCVF